MSNKNNAAQIAKNMGVECAESFFEFENIYDLKNLDDFPESYVLKPVLGSNNRGVFIVEKGVEKFSGQAISIDLIFETLEKLDVTKFTKRFRVEELMVNWDDTKTIPLDFKFYLFSDHLEIVHIVDRNDLAGTKHWFFNEALSPLPYQVQKTQFHNEEGFVFPDTIHEMIKLAKNVGHHFETFIRLDLYATTKGIRFGEFTPYPHGGNGYTEFADEHLGRLWTNNSVT